jgi:hypothetical protein
MLRAIAILLALAIALAGAIDLLGYSSCQQSPKYNSEAAKTEKTYEKYCSTSSATFAVGLTEVGDFLHAHHDGINAFSTVIIALFTVILGLFTISLSRSTRIAAEHIPRVERAYLFLWKQLPNKINANPLGGDILEVQFAFRNEGKTPAILRQINVEIRVTDAYPTAFRQLATDMSVGFTLSSGQTSDFLKCRRLIHPEDWEAARQRKRVVLFLGVVKYKDIFGAPHETGFCLEWDGNGFSPSPTEKLSYYT